MSLQQFQLRWIISESEAGKSIKEFVKVHEISKAALTDIKYDGGKILVNGTERSVRHSLATGDCLEVLFPLEVPSVGMIIEDIPLEIVYEDDWVLVVNKPAFMNTIPSREHPTGSLANGLLGYYREIGLVAAPHIVTRLDRNTSGLVVVAKHRHVHHLMSEQQKRGLVKRTYVALVEGNLKKDFGTIEAPIARKPDSIIEREVSIDGRGQYACTHYHVLGRFAEYNLVELKLETGRTHQIRVHMSYMGHPLLGDDLYGGSTNRIVRQALHCQSVAFVHPIEKNLISFEIPIASDMEKLLKAAPI
ncbi:RluA family pseudouridine synthase [Pseudoneobacillus sp. C159]